MTSKHTTETREDVAAAVATTPCKPRAYSTHTDRLPVPMREGADCITTLPSIIGGYRVWPDGRKEKV
jgi:hypothetical protein